MQYIPYDWKFIYLQFALIDIYIYIYISHYYCCCCYYYIVITVLYCYYYYYHLQPPVYCAKLFLVCLRLVPVTIGDRNLNIGGLRGHVFNTITAMFDVPKLPFTVENVH